MRGCTFAALSLALTLVVGLAAPGRAEWDLFQGNGFNATVYDVVEYRGDLIVTGNFTQAGGRPAAHIARWDGASWQALGKGLQGDEFTNDPKTIFGHCLIVFEGDLYVGGHFQVAGEVSAQFVARWDGEQWHAVGNGFTGRVYDLENFRGRLVAAGNFRRTGVQPAERVAELRNGTWRGLGEGVGAPCLTLQVHEDQLYAGGMFKVSSSGRRLNRVAVWEGTVWIGVGETFEVYESRHPRVTFVQDMTVHNGELTVTGTFDLIGDDPVPGVARWDGHAWQRVAAPGTSLGTIESGFSIASYKGELYLGGRLPGDDVDPMRFLARWNGARWASLGSGVDDFVQALVPIGQELMVGGAFWRVGQQDSRGLAIWRTDNVGVLRPVVDLRRVEGGVALNGRVEGLDSEAVLMLEREAGTSAVRRTVDVRGVLPGEAFSLLDQEAPTGSLRYWVVVETGVSPRQEFGPYAVAATDPPRAGLDLLAATPDAPIRVRLRAAEPGAVRLDVYDLRGRRVRTLLDEAVEPGARIVEWDGRDGSGRRVGRGRYFLRARSEGWMDVVGAVIRH